VHVRIALFQFIGFLANAASDKFLEIAHLGPAAILQVVQVIVGRSLRHLGHDVVEDLELASRKDAVEGLAHANHDDQHEREENRRRLEGLDDPQHDEAAELDEREEMHAIYWNLVRDELVFWHNRV
jgi:hypothetical protein